MKLINYSISPFWDARAMDVKTKMSRIMITINIHGSRQFRITVRLKSTRADFDKAVSPTARNLSDEAKSVRKNLNDYLLKAETILERLEKPTKEVFTRLYKSETDLFVNNKTSIAPFFPI
jgi:integrase/recombinase XerD